MIDRLDEIQTGLNARRELAETKGWLGEVEGIDLTLRFLQDKRAEAQRPARLAQPTWASRVSAFEAWITVCHKRLSAFSAGGDPGI